MKNDQYLGLVAISLALVIPSQAVDRVKLNMIWRSPNSSDYFSTKSRSETIDWGSTAQMFYLFSDSRTGTTPIYRLYDGSGDHMESTSSSEGGYSFEDTLGYAYTSSSFGDTDELVRKVHNYNGDHALSHDDDVLANYSDERMSRYGFKRFGTAQTSLLYLPTTGSVGGVRIGSNRAAGGSLWSFVWNGFEFVNCRDYGRQIQCSLFIPDSSYRGGYDGVNDPWSNPTEAGSNNGDPYYNGGSDVLFVGPLAMGSPVIQIENSSNTQITRAVPLDFNPQQVGGSGQNPIQYRDMVIGKDVTLDYNSFGSVAKYQTKVTLPNSIAWNAVIEIPTAYLVNSLTKAYSYNPATDTLTEVTTNVDQYDEFYDAFTPSTGYGGGIWASADSNYAFGIYGASVANGGSVDYIRLQHLGDNTGSGGQNDNPTKKLTAMRYGSFTAGEKTFTAYLVCGTLSTVRTKMLALYNGNHK